MHKQNIKNGSERCNCVVVTLYLSTHPLLFLCTFCSLLENQPKCRVIDDQSIGNIKEKKDPRETFGCTGTPIRLFLFFLTSPSEDGTVDSPLKAFPLSLSLV